ncbi:MAG: cytochrome [Rhodospirillaceae bacterium]|nr:cytochrome [Rhodospirillaceae bacterium]|tara:strand:- start:1031 stop:2266 length:1236 start_codon:yes stop_codon:yes gene_type:complete
MTESLDDIQLSDPEFWRRPDKHDLLARFRKERPVARQKMHGEDGHFWSLTRHKETREITKNHKLFVSGFGTGMATSMESPELAYEVAGMVNKDAPVHPRLRKIIARVFTPRLLNDIEGQIEASSRTVIGVISERGECDFAADVAGKLPTKVICDMLGVPQGEIRDWLARMSIEAQGYGDEEVGDEKEALKAFFDLNDYGEALCREKRKAPGDDLVSMMIAADADGEKLTDRDVGIYFQLLITAGIETTGSSIAQGMRFLAEHPDQWRDWREDYDGLAGTALEEIVRYGTPVVHFGRTVAEDTEILGQPIAAGEQVVFWYTSANRDETVFEDPQRFDIRRTPNDHVGYGGGGVHHCIGMHLARREMYHFFKTLFEALPDLEVDLDGMQEINALFINGMRHLPCRYTPVRMDS